MEIFQIIAIGFGSGLLLSVISIAFFNSTNAERFPLGGFLPALWLVSDLGGSSQLVEGGMLVMGGMLGYYMILSMWRGMPNRFSEILPQAQDAGHHEAYRAVRRRPHATCVDGAGAGRRPSQNRGDRLRSDRT